MVVREPTSFKPKDLKEFNGLMKLAQGERTSVQQSLGRRHPDAEDQRLFAKEKMLQGKCKAGDSFQATNLI